MDNTIPQTVDVQNFIDNFEAVIKSGDVKLIAQDDEIKLYRGQDNLEYIYDGSTAYSERSPEFASMKTTNFGNE